MSDREPGLSANQRRASRHIAHLIAAGAEPGRYEHLWKAYVTDVATSEVTRDPNVLVQWVLRDAYQESSQSVKDTADKVAFYNDLKRNLREQTQELRTICQTIEEQIARWEERIGEIDDDAQLATTDLQNQLQKQQQMLQMMSNISKSLHDTATSVIRNFGG